MTSSAYIRRIYLIGAGIAVIATGCMIYAPNTGSRINEVDLQGLLSNRASVAVVEQKLGNPYARHFVSAESEVWTYLSFSWARCQESTAICKKWPIAQAILSFQKGQLTDAIVVEKEGLVE
ncbi:MAG: hypothetical protein MN733_25130 [Nitrososphaera sp.]|nr:hypothetical protein [Nitrososphaera sp.]